MAKGWGYAIDYSKEIETDKAEIARLTDARTITIAKVIEAAIASGVFAANGWNTEFVDGWDLASLCYALPEVAEVLGLSRDDLRGIAAANDFQGSHDAIFVHFGGTSETFSADYRRGRELLRARAVPGFEVVREANRIERLRLAKAALSRHTRNAAKFGKGA